MSVNKFTNVKIYSVGGQRHFFDKVKDFQLRVENSMITVQLEDGLFGFPLDRLRYFELGLAPQDLKVNFNLGEVFLSGADQAESELIKISQVINYEWKVDQGLLMVFARELTVGFHLDQVVSYNFKNGNYSA